MMKAWKCELCGYVHTGEQPPQSCPVCGADASHFSPLEIRTVPAGKPSAESWQCSICDHVAYGSAAPEFCPICGASAALFHPYRATEVSTSPPADVRQVVILGAGIAGLTAAEEVHRQAADLQVTLVSREPALPYYRLNLTRFLAGEVTEQDLLIQHQEWFDERGITYLVGDAHSIDRAARKVILRSGRQVDYDRLILANGAHPYIPPIPGAHREGVMVLRTLENVRKIIGYLSAGCRVVCIGGGLLGLESARAMQVRGADVTVLEGFPWLLPRQLPKAAAALLQTNLEEKGMAIECGMQVKEFTGDEAVRGVLLEDGREFPADLVILATGVRPNSHLARECGLKVHHGVIVDDRLYTSDDHILAAGDVTEHLGVVYGIWPASYAQGLVAGANAAGGSLEFTGMPMANRIKVLDVDLFSIGQVQSTDASTRLFEVAENGHYRCVACRDGQVVGAALYGDMRLMGPLREAVEQGRRLQELTDMFADFPDLQVIAG